MSSWLRAAARHCLGHRGRRTRVGQAFGRQSWPIFWVRANNLSFGAPGEAMPDRSPLISAAKTGTPAAEICSAITCSVLVLPVPVAPETSPCRFSMLNGMRMTAAGSGVSFSISTPRSTAGSSKV